jgi:ANTAR domain/PAS fold
VTKAEGPVVSVEAVAFDGSQPTAAVGRYSYTVADDKWSWSEGMYALHGYSTGEVPPSTEVMLRHKHPDDRSRTVEVLEAVIQDGEPFSCYHRIIDRQERLRSVLSVGHGVKGPDARVIRVEGYLVDLTQARRAETEVEIQAALARIAEHREVIDEAKGMVMIATGCDSEAAFRCLRRCSQDANIKVHEIAHRLVETVGPDHRGGDFVMAFLRDLGRSSDPA